MQRLAESNWRSQFGAQETQTHILCQAFVQGVCFEGVQAVASVDDDDDDDDEPAAAAVAAAAAAGAA